ALRGGHGGYAASAEASAGFAACSVDTNRKNRRGQQLICRCPLRIIFCPHPSQTLRIFRWGRGKRKVVLPAFLRNGRNDCDGCFTVSFSPLQPSQL
ncbi:50S ribosomal protein L14e, partial [Dysosmobacter welbionis]